MASTQLTIDQPQHISGGRTESHFIRRFGLRKSRSEWLRSAQHYKTIVHIHSVGPICKVRLDTEPIDSEVGPIFDRF